MSTAEICPNADPDTDDLLEVRTLYRDLVIGTRHLPAHGQGRSGRLRRSKTFRIGVGKRIDAPVPVAFLPSASHVLVDASRGEAEINVTPQMTGEIRRGEETCSLASFAHQRGSRFVLREGEQAIVRCGAVTFFLANTPAPQAIGAAPLVWRWSEKVYPTGSAAVLGLLLLMILSVPEEENALSLDYLAVERHLIGFDIKPPERLEVASPAGRLPGAAASGGGSAGPEGQMGGATARERQNRPAIKRSPDHRDPQLARQLAIEAARESGILGVLARAESRHLASIFGGATALGEAEDHLGTLVGTQIGDAYEIGGLRPRGTGDRGGGTGEGTIGDPRLNTIGPRGRGLSPGEARATTLGHGPRGRQPIPPEFTGGELTVRGTLDREIVRRIVRRHLNQVKYCYELELARTPGLSGRVVVAFTIGTNGRVITSALGSSTLANTRVENCTVQAVRRWEFPVPRDAGLAMVSYPFVLSPAGAR